MDFGLGSLVLEVAIQSTALVVKGKSKKRQQKAEPLLAALQTLDVDEISSRVSPATLVRALAGPLQFSDVKPVLSGEKFRNLLKTMFLASVCDTDDRQKEQVRDSMSIVLGVELIGKFPKEIVGECSEIIVGEFQYICDSIVEQIRSIDSRILIELQQTALLKRISTILESIDPINRKLHASFTSEFIIEKKSWTDDYLRICRRSHGNIIPPDFDSIKKIPIGKLYVTPTISPRRGIETGRMEVVDFSEFCSTIDRTVILGDPGGGKSTLTNFLTSEYAKDSSKQVPFHITLREFAKVHEEKSLLQFIELKLRTQYQASPPQGLVEDMLLNGEAVVILDGLDELIDTSKRRAITNIVEIFGMKYPHTKLLVTSRKVGYDQAKLDSEIFSEYVVAGFAQKDCETYVRNWFACQDGYSESEATALADSFIKQSGTVKDLRSNPLMLSLMCIIFRGENFIPRNRPAVYEKCSTLLFEKWDGHREIEVPLKAKSYVDEAMKYFAYWMLESENYETGVRVEVLVKEMTSYLAQRAFDSKEVAARAAQEFVDFCKGRAWVFSDAGSTADGEPLFTFAHRTFMEYFAAYHLTRTHDTPEKLARTLLPKVAKQEWDVVAQLAVQIEEKSVDRGSERVLNAMVKERRKRTTRSRSFVLQFVAQCLAFSNTSPPFIRMFTEKCIDFAVDYEKSKSRESINELYNPWIALLSGVSSDHYQLISEVHSTRINEYLCSTESDRRDYACMLILVGLKLAWQHTRSEVGNAYSKQWSDTFLDISTNNSSHLIEFCGRYPSHLPSLLLAGLRSANEIFTEYESRGFSPQEMIFAQRVTSYGGDHLSYYWEPVTFVDLMQFGAITSPDKIDSWLLTISSLTDISIEIIRVFNIEGNLRWSDSLATTSVSWQEPCEALPQEVRDAYFILSLVGYETMVGRQGIRRLMSRYAQSDGGEAKPLRKVLEARDSGEKITSEDVEKISASGKMNRFILRWANHEISFFEEACMGNDDNCN